MPKKSNIFQKVSPLKSLFLAIVSACSIQSYASQDLSSLINHAKANNPVISAQQQLSKSAEQGVEAAKWQYWPTPVFSVQKAQTSASDTAYQGDDMVINVGLQQPLWTGGKLDAGLAKSENEYKASIEGLSESVTNISLEVVQAYSDWLTAKTKIEVSERNIETHKKLYNRIERRVKEGASAQSDLTLALSRLQQAEADLFSAKTAIEAAIAQLSQLTGISVDQINPVSVSSEPIAKTAAKAVRDTLENHPLLKKLQNTSQALLAEVDVQAAAMYPDVVAKIEKQEGNLQIKGAPSDMRYFLTVQSKLGAGLSTISAVESAKSKQLASLSDIEAAKRSLTQQVLREWSIANNLSNRLTVLENALISAKQIQESYDRQFVSGKKSWLDVVNAARELAQTENQLAEAKGGLVNSSWKLRLLTSQEIN